MVGLTVQQTIASGGVAAGLVVVSTFCWWWRHRCQHKATLELLDKLGKLEKDP